MAEAQWLRSIRADKKLSAQGKELAIARRYLAEKQRERGQAAEGRAASEDSRSRLHARLFGTRGSEDPSTAISLRDAQARAEAVRRPAEAGRMMRRALDLGDDQLARAVLAVAWQRREGPLGAPWHNQVVPQFFHAHPELLEVADELQDAEAGARGETGIERARRGPGMPAPAEMRRHGNEAGIERFVRSMGDSQEEGDGMVGGTSSGSQMNALIRGAARDRGPEE